MYFVITVICVIDQRNADDLGEDFSHSGNRAVRARPVEQGVFVPERADQANADELRLVYWHGEDTYTGQATWVVL